MLKLVFPMGFSSNSPVFEVGFKFSLGSGRIGSSLFYG